MIAANDASSSLLDGLAVLAPDQLRMVIAHAAGLHAHHTSIAETEATLFRIGDALRPPAERVTR